jgi:hypothetical protein
MEPALRETSISAANVRLCRESSLWWWSHGVANASKVVNGVQRYGAISVMASLNGRPTHQLTASDRDGAA